MSLLERWNSFVRAHRLRRLSRLEQSIASLKEQIASEGSANGLQGRVAKFLAYAEKEHSKLSVKLAQR